MPPPGWIVYTVRFGDTLHSLSTRDGASVDAIIAANCLTTEDLRQGDLLYLPSTPSPLPTPCSGPPRNWERYTVQRGDTMFSLATGRGVTIYEVLRANCLSSSRMRAGQTLYLPPTPADTTLTPPPIASPTLPLPGPTARPSGSVCAFVSPADGANIDGQVSFAGTATADQFLFFKLEAYGPETNGLWASLLGGVVRTPVVGGVLGTADLGMWSPGSYSIRLTVVDTTYNEVSRCYLSLNVSPP
jgi:LysM repeat protein